MVNSIRDVVEQGRLILKKAEINHGEFDLQILVEHHFGFSKTQLVLKDGAFVSDIKTKEFFQSIEKRCQKIPLQYIVEKWEFYNLEFFVGDGVLIPRQDTERVCDVVLDLEFINLPTVVDLCSGTGCIGMTIEKNRDTQDVILVEKSEKALVYLKKNKMHNRSQAKIIHGDIFDVLTEFEDNSIDLVVSNPPYIETQVLKTLSDEVKNEPVMALDGGKDGLDFYRKITKRYKSKLKKGGYLVFEIGFDQGAQVQSIMEKQGFYGIKIEKDYGGNQRVIVGKK